jgi:hypothetical protein
MELKIAKWKDNAVSPVIFMVDDIANISVKPTQSNTLKIGEDWGQYGRDKNSMWDFLSKNLLDKFPKIKTTFFLVTDKRAPMALGEEYTYNKSIIEDQKFIDFLKYLHHNKNVELAYHGTTHGEAAIAHDDFLQEWETFYTLEQAKSEINRGKELFKSAIGAYPTGGKYCGYKEGAFGSESIAKTSFKWWSYHWDGMIWDKNSKDSKYNYDLEFNQGVVDIPTTVDAATLSLRLYKKLFTKKYLKSLFLYLKENKTIEKHIESLYQNKQVIAIQEHSSPYRTDGKIQYPNIVSDIDNLNLIFSLLSKKDVWYTTGDELADYFITRSNLKVSIKDNEFKLISKKFDTAETTLTIKNDNKQYALYDKNNSYISEFKVKDSILYLTYRFKTNILYKIKTI